MLPRERAEGGGLDEEIPWIALGLAPDGEQVNRVAVALGDLDAASYRDAIAHLDVHDRLRRRLAGRALDEDGVVARDSDGPAVAGRHLEAPLVRRMAHEGVRTRDDHPAGLGEARDGHIRER